MDALILSCGTGGGHNAAGKAIQETLERRGHAVTMLNPYTLRSKRLAQQIDHTYIHTVQKVPNLFGAAYGVGQLYSKLPFRSPVYWVNHRMVSAVQAYLGANHFDVVIMPHLFSAEIMANLKRRKISTPPTLFVSTDYTCTPFTEETDCDAYVIPSPALAEVYIAKGLPPEKLHPIGIPVSRRFRRTECREEVRARLGLDIAKEYILVTGGSMGGGKIEKAIDALIDGVADRPETGLIVICGSNQALYDKLTAAHHPQMTVIGYTNDMADYMKAADLFITKPGGLSSTEAAVCGVPILHTAAIPGCETYNAQYFSQRGMSVACEASEDMVHRALSLLNDGPARTAMVERQREHIDPQAAEKICQLAEELTSRDSKKLRQTVARQRG